MPRQAKNPQRAAELGRRLREALLQLGLGHNELARRLQLTTTSSIRSACAGKGFLDVDRLALLAQIHTPRGEHVNLHWLITGDGTPLASHRSRTQKGAAPSHEVLNALRVLCSHLK